jgi:hypothetical protein
VPPQPPGTLDQKVDRRKIGYHEVEIEVETLLNNLRCDEHPTASHIHVSVTAEAAHHFRFDKLAIAHRKPRVEQKRIKSRGVQLVPGGDCLVDAVPDKSNARACFSGCGDTPQGGT